VNGYWKILKIISMEDRTAPVKAEIEQYETFIKEKKERIRLLTEGIKYDTGRLKWAKKYLESLTKEDGK
jgi:hypothetical protein